MNEHPIEGLMETAMNSIKDMIDVNTIIGDPIETSNGMVIIPISKVCFGFAAGGSEFKGETIDEYKKRDKEEEVQYRLPFGGGSGAGISINPVAFVIVSKESIKVLPIEHSSVIDKLMDYVPDLMEKANIIVDRTMENQSKTVDKDIPHPQAQTPKKPKIKTPIKPKNQIVKDISVEQEEISDKQFESESEYFDGE